MKISRRGILKNPIFKNFFFLAILQGSNYLLPLVLIPYLIKTIGEENFGKVSFAQAIINYLIIVVDYGFNLSATRAISEHHHNKEKVVQIFNEVFFTKIFLTFPTFLFLILIVLIFPKLYQDALLYLSGYLMVVGQVILPVWLFQGLQKMQFLTYANLLGKIITFVCIVVFIKEPQAYRWILFWYGVGSCTSGILSLLIARLYAIRSFFLPSWNSIVVQLKNSWHLFVSMFTISFYTQLHLIILGIFTTDRLVGYYNVADKVVSVLRNFVQVFNQAVYPTLFNSILNKAYVRMFFRKYFLFFMIALGIITLVLYWQSTFIITLLAGTAKAEIINILNILLLAPILIALHLRYGGLLLALKADAVYSKVLLKCSILSVIINSIGVNLGQATGLAVSVVLIEGIILLLFAYTLKRLYSQYFKLSD